MTRRLRPALAALLLAGSLAGPIAAATPAAAADPNCVGKISDQGTFYGLQYFVCLSYTANTFTAKTYARGGSAYSFGGVKLAVRIYSNGARITGDVCESATIDTDVSAGRWKSCTVQTPRGHTGNDVQGAGWVAFDGRCPDDPRKCIGYRSAYPEGVLFTSPVQS